MRIFRNKFWSSDKIRVMKWFRSLLYRLDVPLAIRVGITACAAFLTQEAITFYFPRPDQFIGALWCVLSAIIVSQANLGKTLKAGQDRFLGGLIGCFLGSLFTVLYGATVVTLGVSVALTVMICAFLNLQDAIRIASLSVAVVMLSWANHTEFSPWAFGFFRFLDSVIGIVVAVLVSHLILPTQAEDAIKTNVSDAILKIKELFHSVVHFEFNKDTAAKLSSDIINSLLDTHKAWDEAKLELFTQSRNVDSWTLVIHQAERLHEMVLSLASVYDSATKQLLDESLEKQTVRVAQRTEEAMERLAFQAKTGSRYSIADSLNKDLDLLNDELQRFRTTRVTRNFELISVQNFFVLFYTLRAIVEELQKLETTLLQINAHNQE